MRYLLPLAVALTGAASAQIVLPVNPAANNGGSVGWANFSDFTAAPDWDLRITHMTTASTAAIAANFDIEVFVRAGSGLGGPVAAGPGSDPMGWTSLGTVTATQGAVASGISELIDIPDIFVPRGSTVGVAFRFVVGAGPRYFGTGTPPYGVFSDGSLTVTTGDGRSAPFTTTGSFFSSRGHVGEFRYERASLTITDCVPGAFVDISATGTPLNLSDDGSVDIVTTVGNILFPAGSARVGSNGAVGFAGAAGTALAFTNTSLPGATAFAGAQALLPFWDDVNTVSGLNGNIFWQEIGNTLYVQWNNVDFFGGGIDTATFQVQVHGSGPALAQFVYTDIEGARADGGASATVGYQPGPVAGPHVQYLFDAYDALKNGTVLTLMGAEQVVWTPDLPGAWIDISGSGAPLNLGDDDEVDIPTTVGNALVQAGVARVGSNGAIRFAGSNLALGFGNTALPSTNCFNQEQALAPFWDDFNTVGGTVGNIYWQEIGNTLIVQWDNAGFFNSADTATFQVQVHGNGPVLAQYLYQDVSSVRAGNGNSATIGYQGGGIRNTAQYSFNTASVSNGTVLSLVDARYKVGASYCTPVANSTGTTGQMLLLGSASLTRNNLRLRAQELPQNSFGFFLCSLANGAIPNAGGGVGTICLGGNIGRGVAGGVYNSGGDGAFGGFADLNNLPQPAGSVAAVAGETWHFQAWHRDSVGGTPTSNLTNGVQVQITP
jgi:hypothetical protein